MRILQVITLCDLGGAQSVVVNLANKLCQKHEIVVVAGEGSGKMWGLLDPTIITERIPYLHRELVPLDELRVIIALKKLYSKYKPDIIHLHSSKVGVLGRLVFPKLKVLYTIHGFDSIRIAYRKYLPIEKALQQRCQAIVGVSKYDVNNLREESIVNNVSCIYNGVSLSVRPVSNPFSHIKGYSGKVLCIARLSPPKRADLFIQVASLLPQYAFIWVGNQEEVQLQYPTNVFFLGNIPNAGIYNEFVDLLMLPSDYEGLPMVIIEALACGKPIVASAVGGIPELLNGENGFAVNNDAKIMADKINLILSDEYLKKNMGFAAKRTYLEHFTVDRMVEEYMTIYDRIYKLNHC